MNFSRDYLATVALPSLSFFQKLIQTVSPFSPKTPINHFAVNSSDMQPDVYFDIYLGDHRA